MLQMSLETTAPSLYKKVWVNQTEAFEDDGASQEARFTNTQDLLRAPPLSAAQELVKAGGQFVSSCSGSCISGLPRLMEETSCCDTSFAVDCTLSLGSATSRPDIPSRLSRAGSPAQDLAWPRSVRSEQVDAPMRRTCEKDTSEQGTSWGGSCNRSDPNITPDDYPQATVSGREARAGEIKQRSGSNAWPRCSKSSKEEVVRPKGLLSMLESPTYDSHSGRQSWLPNFLSSNGAAAEGKASSRVERCMQDGNSLVRVCAHCGTTKTPLWRNGPQGPKSLCNACGIRFKKAGRRLAASANSELQSCPPGVVTTTKVGKRKLGDEMSQQYWVYPSDSRPKKQSRGVFLRPSDSLMSGGSCVTWQPCLLSPAPQTSLQRDCHASPRSRSQEQNLLQMGAFSTDEEEGAVLLMALSCGMVLA